jgi:hypothetical protein
MSPELRALKDSIRKWEDIVAGTGADKGAQNCPLCEMFYGEMFYYVGQDGRCAGCPVFLATGDTDCAASPYLEWTMEARSIHGSRFNDGRIGWFATTPELIALAQAELDFLRSLLPEKEKEA